MFLLRIISIILFFTPLSIFAQKIEAPLFSTDSVVIDSTNKRWTGNIGLGLDATAITLINPRVTEGEGRVNFGSLLNFNFNYQGNRLLWSNRGSVQLALTKIGTEDWTKSTDALLWNTQFGVRVYKKWYAAMMADVQTQMLPTYDSKFIRPQDMESKLTSKFFAPASLKLAPGMLWKPNQKFSLMISAISNKNIIVTDPSLTTVVDSTEGVPVFGNTFGKEWTSQFGAELRADLNLKFADDKVLLNSVFDVYSNYLKSPENIAVEWLTSLDIVLSNHFSVNVRSEWFYDHDILVKVGFNDDDLGRRVFIRNTFFLKYSKTF